MTQQTEYIARHTRLSCKGYCGDMNVDYWTKETWLQELEEYQVYIINIHIFLSYNKLF